jgi:hypothetical protein
MSLVDSEKEAGLEMQRQEETKAATAFDSESEPSPSPVLLEKAATEVTFPDGGITAWSIALASAGVLFCTFGYVNSFGYALFPIAPWAMIQRVQLAYSFQSPSNLLPDHYLG